MGQRLFSSAAWRLAVVLLWLLPAPGRALAQSCSFSIDDVDFGSVDLSAGTTPTVTAQLKITCFGQPNRWVIVCPSINAGSGGVASGGDPRYMDHQSSPAKLKYNLYRPGSSSVWGSYVWPHAPRPPVFGLYLQGSWFFGFASGTTTIEARITPGQAGAPAGDFQSLFSGNATYFEYDYYSSGVWCNNMPSPSVAHPSFRVRARNEASCAVSATDLDFGTTGLLNTAVDAANTISVRCTSGVEYQIGLSGGDAGASDPAQRKMSNGPHEVRYGIYSNAARTQGWGDVLNDNTVSALGNGSWQNHTAYGRVPPQPTPPPGTYADTIVVTVTY